MRWIIACLFITTCAPSLFAQDPGAQPDEGIRNLFNEEPGAARGGYFAVSAGTTGVMNTTGLLMGGHGGWLLGHRVLLGGGGYGLMSNVPAMPYDAYLRDNGVIAGPSRLRFGYGGAHVEFIVNYKAPVHLSFPVLIGYGGCNIDAVDVDVNHVPGFDPGVLDQGFFVVQPGAMAEVNVIEHLRIGLGVDYRYTSDVYLTSLPADALRGFNGMMTVKLGQF